MKAQYALALLVAAAPVALAQPAAGVSLQVSEETTPAGGVAQIKVFLTEPKPIVRTGIGAVYDESFIDAFLGIAAAGGLNGVATARDGRFRVELNSLAPAGLEPDYPLLTVAVRMKPDLPVGASMPFSIDLGASFWLNPARSPYPAETHPGSVTIGGSMFVSDVLPGGGELKPGETFRVLGSGFSQALQVRAEGARLQSYTSSQLLLAAKQRIQLDGTRIRIRLENGEEQTYFSYLRGLKTAPSLEPALQSMVPVFSTGAAHEALAALSHAAGDVNAIGLQNPTDAPGVVALSAVSIFGQSLMSAEVRLGPREVVFLSFQELFGAAEPPNALSLQAQSAGAFQLTLAHVNRSTGQIQIPQIVTLRRAAY